MSAWRRARPEDVAAIHGLDRAWSPVFSDASRYRTLLDGNGVLLVVETPEAGIIGFSACTRVLDEATLLNIALNAEVRGRGLGRRLLEATIADLQRQGIRRLLLEVRGGNGAALALYRGCGFSEDGVRRGYYRAVDGGPREDAITMSCDLESYRESA